MSTPTLWAPNAREVQLELDGALYTCRRRGEHWTSPVELVPGQRYRFVVDGAAMPDPRSRSQPEGVHAATEVVAPLRRVSAGVETTMERSVIYELHVGTFSAEGTFLGAVAHLDHLVQLGVTHVELMPVAAFDGRFGWGYDGVDLFAPHPSYGSLAELAALVDACHRRGLSVLTDVVLNHLGPSGNYLALAGPYFTDRYRTPWGDAMNLDGPGADGVRSLLVDAALHWLEDVGVDGLRLDAVHALFDQSATHLLEQLADAVRSLERRTGRRLLLIAESDRNDPRIVADGPVGPGLDAVWSDDLHHCLHVALTGERHGYYEDYRPEDLGEVLRSGVLYQGRWSPHRGRTVGRSHRGVPSESLVVALQNHDQVGNRAAGERLHHLVGVDRCLAAASLVLLSPYSVLLFQGEEFAASAPFPYFSDHEGTLGDAVRAGRRREFAAFGWQEHQIADPQDPATYRRARLDWDEAAATSGPHAEALAWYRTLVGLRAELTALGSVTLPAQDRHTTLRGSVVSTSLGDLSIVANLGSEAASAPACSGEVLVERGEIVGSAAALSLGPGAVRVLHR